MNAKDWIESYVQEVATQLPRTLRNDVAFELRALLNEELQAKADEQGREADATMAAELLKAFGRPVDVAARYRPTLIIIDPADGRSFLRATVIGLVIIWSLGLVKSFSQPVASGWDLLQVLSHWWWGTVLPSPWWPGLLVGWYGLSAWSRRRGPQRADWKPRTGDRLQVGRTGLVMAVLGIFLGVYLLVDARRVLEVVWGGRIAPAALEALTYTDTFRQLQGPWLLGLLLLNVPLLITVIVQGRWSATLRRLETALCLLTCAAMVWTVLDGPVFITPMSDQTAKALMSLIVVLTLIGLGFRWWRTVRPAPSQAARAQV